MEQNFLFKTSKSQYPYYEAILRWNQMLKDPLKFQGFSDSYKKILLWRFDRYQLDAESRRLLDVNIRMAMKLKWEHSHIHTVTDWKLSVETWDTRYHNDVILISKFRIGEKL